MGIQCPTLLLPKGTKKFTKLSLLIYFNAACYNSSKREVRSMNMSSLQGIVRPPIG